MVTVSEAAGKPISSRTNGCAPCVRDEHEFPFKYVHEFILLHVSMAGGGLAARRYPHVVDTVVLEAGVIAHPRLRCAGALAAAYGANGKELWHLAWLNGFQGAVGSAFPIARLSFLSTSTTITGSLAAEAIAIAAAPLLVLALLRSSASHSRAIRALRVPVVWQRYIVSPDFEHAVR